MSSNNQMWSFQRTQTPIKIWAILLLLISNSSFTVESKCKKGCPLALASYYVWDEANITFIAKVLGSTDNDVLSYNPSVPDDNRLQSFIRVNVPFSCDCINHTFMGHIFQYKAIKGDTYDLIAGTYYANLTTVSWIQQLNSFDPNNLPLNAIVNVPVNCSCGSSAISKDYGLFLTYPLRPEENLTYIDQLTNSTPSLLQLYNPNVNIGSGSGILFIPAKDKTGKYPPLTSSSGAPTTFGLFDVIGGQSGRPYYDEFHFCRYLDSLTFLLTQAGLSGGVIAGITVAVAVAVAVGVAAGLVMITVVYRVCNKKRIACQSLDEPGEKSKTAAGATRNMGMTVSSSIKFSYEELAQATNNFSMANKIGSGGFGDVYYAELSKQKVAIKKMDMKSSKEFLAELKVLTHVHHLNLVCLIGYCVKKYYFLVYEYIENGNLSEHLRGSGTEPLPWLSRVQIALDSARGLEYIHEHTVPVYIHRDIKPANILIDKNFRAKVADFGLAKLVGKFSEPTRLIGTFGYMAPEYGHYGEITPKADVFAFGVVLYELISAKTAIVRDDDKFGEAKPLSRLFEAVLDQHDPNEFRRLVDVRLGNDYPLDSVYKMARLAKACTQENPELRPTMRFVVVALTTMSSTSGDWNVGSFFEDSTSPKNSTFDLI